MNECPKCHQYKLGVSNAFVFFMVFGVMFAVFGIFVPAMFWAAAFFFGMAWLVKSTLCKNCHYRVPNWRYPASKV